MNVQEIEATIAELPHDEFWQLMDRLNELQNQRWDEEIARDVEAGRFDEIIARGKRTSWKGGAGRYDAGSSRTRLHAADDMRLD